MASWISSVSSICPLLSSRQCSPGQAPNGHPSSRHGNHHQPKNWNYRLLQQQSPQQHCQRRCQCSGDQRPPEVLKPVCHPGLKQSQPGRCEKPGNNQREEGCQPASIPQTAVVGGKTQPCDNQQHERVNGDEDIKLIAGKRAAHESIVP